MSRDTLSDRFRDRLSDYIDGNLSPTERAEVDTHLAGCADCRELIGDLRSLRGEARRLPPVVPPDHLWRSIETRLRSRELPRARRSRFYTGLAAAAALVLGVSLWIAVSSTPPEPEDPNALANRVTEELRLAESHYQNAIGGLEQIIDQNKGSLPAELDETLRENLDLIEQSIAESRDAISTDPQSPAAKDSLLAAFRRKVNLLRSTILLINEIRKGEGESALDLINEIQDSEEPPNSI